MSKFLSIATEDETPADGGLADPNGKPDELEKANDMVQNEDSTDPAKVVKIANYKEELAALQEQQEAAGDETTDPTNPTGDAGATEDTGSAEGEGDAANAEGSDDPESTDEDVSTDESSGDEDEANAEDGEVDEEGLSDDDAEQLTEATESYATLTRLRKVIHSAKERNNFSNTALEMFSISVESIKTRLGITHETKYEMPAMEDLSGFTARQKYTDAMVVAFEGIVSDVWEAIVRMFRALTGWIKDFFFKKDKSVRGAREDLKAMEASNKSLIKGLEKKEELKGKTKDGQTVDEPTFSSQRAGDLLVPGKDPSSAASINESFVLMNDSLKEQFKRLNDVAAGYEKLLDDVFKAQEVDDIKNLGARGFISSYLNTNGLEKATMIPGEDLSNYIAFKTPVLTLNTGYYFKFIERGQSKQGIDKNVVKQQRFGSYYGDDSTKGAKIPLINNKDQANKILEWMKAIQANREVIVAKGKALSKDVENYTKTIEQFKSTGNQLDALIAELLGLICVILSNVVVKGYNVIENNYEKYSQLLAAYHAESVKEYGIS
ncbi:MAG: hypothetical protein RR877_00690 [Aurantimicrobium sp.]|uniref:hypothetical protein n=1 Tax=Aurantimicrobium sp. TaxID=1930784 RepID=UPI002FC66921